MPDPTGTAEEPGTGSGRRWLGAFALAALGVLALTGSATALHGGIAVDALDPGNVTPGDAVRIDFTKPDDAATTPPYAATDVVIHAPVVDDTTLPFDPSETGGWGASENWEIVDATPETVRYNWTGDATVDAPGNLTVVMGKTMDTIEGEASWDVEFCTYDDYYQSFEDTSLRYCPDDHAVQATNVFDNKAPETEIRVKDLADHTEPPYYAGLNVTLDSTDGGSGVDTTYYQVDDGAIQTYDGPFKITTPGLHEIRFLAVDNVTNEETVHKPSFVAVDGLDFAAVPDTIRAGKSFTVIARFAEDVTRQTNAGIPGADYPVTVTLESGPEPLDDGGEKTASDGVATYPLSLETAGTYVLQADHPHIPAATSKPIVVEPAALSRIEVSPSSTTVPSGGTVQLQADGFDPYNNSLPVQPTWAASCGEITQKGQFIASTKPQKCTIVAAKGPVKGAAEVRVESTSGGGSGDGGGDDGSAPSVGEIASSTHPVGTWVNATEFQVSWEAPGPSVAGYAYKLAETATDPGSDITTESASASMAVPDDGNWTLSVKPVFGDGSTGKVATYGPILVDTQAPAPPGVVDAEGDTDGVRVAWDPVTASDGSPISSYLVSRQGPGDDGYEVVSDGTIDGTTFDDADVRPGRTYRYRVAAIDAAGNQGPSAKSVEATVPENATTEGSDDGPADDVTDLSALYEALGVEPSGARLVDDDGDGVAETLTGDPRLTVADTAQIQGKRALLVGLGDSGPKAVLVPATQQAHKLQRVSGTVGGQKLTDDGTIVTAQVPEFEGWALVELDDPLPGADLDRVFDKGGDRIPNASVWRTDGAVVFLDDGSPTYILQYASTDTGRPASGSGASTPGPSMVLAALAAAGAAVVWRRRD